MLLQPAGTLSLNYFRGSIPFQTQPGISLPDISVGAVLGNNAGMDLLTVDQIAGCIYARPMFVPHNQSVWLLGAPFAPLDDDIHLNLDLPTWRWDLVELDDGTETSPNLFEMQYFRAKTWAHQTLDTVWNSGTNPMDARATFTKLLGGEPPSEEEEAEGGPFAYYDTVQGIVCFLSRSIYNKIPANAECYYDIQVEIDEKLYSLKISSAEYGQFRVSEDDGATWKVTSSAVKIGSGMTDTMGSKPPDRGQNPLAFEFLVLNDQLQVKIGSQQVPLSFPIRLVNDGYPEITKVIVDAKCFTQFSCEVHPLKFATQGLMLSNPLSIGFSPSNTPYYRIAGLTSIVTVASGEEWEVAFPDGSALIVDQAGLDTDADQQYLLTIANPEEGVYSDIPYAAKTAAATCVHLIVDGIWAVVPTTPRNVVPKEIRETIRLDMNRLTIDQSLAFTLNNIYGQWRGQSGNIVVGLSLGYAQPSSAYFPRFTGLCGRYEFARPASNVGTVTFRCQSFMKQLADGRNYSPPVMDGWNHYYAVAFLAQMAGISLQQMAFTAMIPSDPYSSSGWDPDPFFLPLGDGMRTWTPRNCEHTILELIDYVRGPAGFMLFFDAQGYMRYEKWLPFAPGTHVRIFTEGPTGADGENLTEYFNLRLVSDIEEVRNQVLLVGVDQFNLAWPILPFALQDDASIYAFPGSEPLNYIGYKKTFTWVGTRFANQAYAAFAAERLLELLRVPGIEVTFETWLQPDIYPMDVIYIFESKSGTEGVPFYVIETENTWAYEGQKQVARTTITGKFLVA